jgi:hypothetical protein
MRPLLIALAFLTAAAPASAQETEQEVTTQIVQEAIVQSANEPAVTAEGAFNTIQDFGLLEAEGQALTGFSLGVQGNLALVRQTGLDNVLGVGNTAEIEQRGAGNLAVLLQLGDGNLTTLLQEGAGNVFGARITGSNNTLDGVVQRGADNLYLLDYEGSGRMIEPSLQEGDGNQVVQIGATDAPFGVQQYGDGLRMIIRHNGGGQ